MIRWNITFQHIKSMICPILYLKIFFLTVLFVFQSEWPTQIICSYWLHGRRQHTTWVRTFENYFEKYAQCGYWLMNDMHMWWTYDTSHDCMHVHVLWGYVLEMMGVITLFFLLLFLNQTWRKGALKLGFEFCSHPSGHALTAVIHDRFVHHSALPISYPGGDEWSAVARRLPHSQCRCDTWHG